jgi:hypothetical protein
LATDDFLNTSIYSISRHELGGSTICHCLASLLLYSGAANLEIIKLASELLGCTLEDVYKTL